MAAEADIDIEEKTFEAAAEAEETEGIPTEPADDADDPPIAALTGCRLELRLPTS